jgi:alanine racemase
MRPTRAIIDLGKLDHNIKQLKSLTANNTQFMAVVKADAYGHGAIAISKQSIKSGASCLAVAIPEEGIQLREAGIDVPILVLGPIDESEAELVVRYNLVQTIFKAETALILDKLAKRYNKKVDIHIKIDTGMGRIGIRSKRELMGLCDILYNMRNINIQGVFTHFAVSDIKDKEYTLYQLKQFNGMITLLKDMGINPKYIHAANSAAIIDCPYTHFNLVRGGISMYGYYPSEQVLRNAIDINPILQWETRIMHVKYIEKGESVGYGRNFIAEHPTKVATIPVGYADGYNRLLSNRGHVLINGQKAPIVGNICMDQTMIDISNITNASIDDNVILLGKQENEEITADDLAKLCNTISYEILTNISSRVPRLYK